MIMTDGIPVCDVCNIMEGPESFLQLWPAEIRGAYGPGRVFVEPFHVCGDCIRERFATDRLAAIERDRRTSLAGWRLFGRSMREQALAEAALRDRELGGAA